MGSGLPPQLASIEKEVRDIFKILSTGFQKLDQTKDEGRQTKQLESLTAKMREAKRLIKEFDREMKEEEGNINPESIKLLNETKQSLIKELNSFVALRKTYTSSIGNKHELLDGGSCAGSGRDVLSQEHVATGGPQMDETVETIERTNKVMKSTTDTEAETATTVKVQTEQVSRVNSKVDTTQPSIRKMARNRCIMLLLLLITICIIVVIMLKVVRFDDEVPSSAPPIQNRRLLMTAFDLQQVSSSSALPVNLL